MCFGIKLNEQKRWANRVVYKRFCRPATLLLSPYQNARYKLGARRAIAKSAQLLKYADEPPRYYNNALEGLYVYRTKADAMHYVREDEVVVACRVNPTDFLYHNEANYIATYRALTPMKIVYKGWDA